VILTYIKSMHLYIKVVFLYTLLQV